ncbi:MAG: type II toxin-antitoxin system RelE/ParE family toxin [Spirochaetia bacterium]
MTRELIIRPNAEAEMAEAQGWYESRSPGLGADFLLSVDAGLQAIARNPLRFPVVYRDVRRALTKRFPYQIFFVVEDDRVVVLAVFHARRNPSVWQGRT